MRRRVLKLAACPLVVDYSRAPPFFIFFLFRADFGGLNEVRLQLHALAYNPATFLACIERL